MRRPLASVLLAVASLPVSAQTSLLTVGKNVQVSVAHRNEVHDELLAAADPRDPKRLMACVIIGTFQPEDQHTVYASFDGGMTWSAVLQERAQHGLLGDPGCAFGPNNNAYSTVINNAGKASRLVVQHSVDGGRTWMPSAIPLPNSGIDRDHVIADNTGSKYRGRVYLYGQFSAHQFDGGNTPMGFTLWRSLDGGQTFDRPVQVFPPDRTTVFWISSAAVLSDGTLAVLVGQPSVAPGARNDESGPPKVNATLKVVTSTDGGETLEPAVKVSDYAMDWREAGNGIASFAGDPGSTVFKDRLYATWSDGRTGRTQAVLSYSADKGKTWSPFRTVNDDRRPAGDPAHDVGLTAVAVNKDGVVGVMWEDRRNSANNLDYEIRFAASFDGGMTFTPSVRVSEQPRVVGAGETWIASRRPLNEDAKPDPFVATLTVRRDEWVNAGHTMGLTATVDGSFHPVWVDNRTGINQLWTAAIGVHGTPMKNGAADLAMLEDVTGKSLLEMTNVSWDRGRNELTVTARLKNASKATITGPLKLRALELNS